MSVADLPDYSVIGTYDAVFIKNHPSSFSQWRSTDGGYYGYYRDATVDEYLRLAGLTVEQATLRIGMGELPQ